MVVGAAAAEVQDIGDEIAEAAPPWVRPFFTRIVGWWWGKVVEKKLGRVSWRELDSNGDLPTLSSASLAKVATPNRRESTASAPRVGCPATGIAP